MSALGYIFLTTGREGQVAPGDQQKVIQDYGRSVGLTVEEFFVEQGVSLKSPFRERKEAGRLLAGAQPGDIIITMNSEWILGSAREGIRLIRLLKKNSISLYCLDLKEDISIPSERKLLVSEGGSALILAVYRHLQPATAVNMGSRSRRPNDIKELRGSIWGGLFRSDGRLRESTWSRTSDSSR
jgi:DNA invertase Pin-like site-specific DNA recombinase